LSGEALSLANKGIRTEEGGSKDGEVIAHADLLVTSVSVKSATYDMVSHRGIVEVSRHTKAPRYISVMR
jgi:hypothetical protein